MLQTILERFLVKVSKRDTCQDAVAGTDASRAVTLAKSLISPRNQT